VNDSAVTVTVIMSVLRRNNIQDMVSKHKGDVNPTSQLPFGTS